MAAQRHTQQFANHGVVIDDEDLSHGVPDSNGNDKSSRAGAAGIENAPRRPTAGPKVSPGPPSVGGVRLAQKGVELVLEQQLFLFQQLNRFVAPDLNAGFHVLDLLIQGVVLVKQTSEMVVAGFELGNQFTVFWKHANSCGETVDKTMLNTGCRMPESGSSKPFYAPFFWGLWRRV
jgi:hypothetical protein